MRDASHNCPPPRPEQPPLPPGALWLSPAEAAVLRRLREAGGWVVGRELAKAADRDYDPRFQAVLMNLVERGILRSSQGQGYRLVTSL